jgi:crotonobetaine/carnitine-CoA ligase
MVRAGGADYTYSAIDAVSSRMASSLSRRGVTVGTKVGYMLPNCAEFVILWFALAKLGAVAVGIDDRARAAALVHQLTVTDTELLVVDESLTGEVLGLLPSLPQLRVVVVHGDDCARLERSKNVEVVALGSLLSEPSLDLTPGAFDEFDPLMIVLTSGTTGPAKPCVFSHHYALTMAGIQREVLNLTEDDVSYSPFPIYHIASTVFSMLPAFAVGGVAAIGRRFSVSNFWQEIRDTDATAMLFMGVTLALLWKAPCTARDRDHKLRIAWGEPVPEWGPEFEARFGIKLLECYGTTQTGTIIYDRWNEEHRPRSCGRPIGPYELRICRQGTSDELAAGEIGELHVKATRPGALFDGYYGQPETTAAAFDGEWYRTGDLLSRDEAAHYYFSGRMHDAIRRRGELIGAFEIEQVIHRHDTVKEVAVIAVADELSGEEIKACLVARAGMTIDLREIVTYCAANLPGYMIPRYFVVVPEIEKSAHGKMMKQPLRDAGLTHATWDRENPGDRAKSERIGGHGPLRRYDGGEGRQ